MQSRQSIVDIFSTFLRLEEDQSKGWMKDAKLHRSIQSAIAAHSETGSEQFWTVFWHQSWWHDRTHRQSAIALDHLSACLQEACYWSARSLKLRTSTVQYSLADFFQVAISEVPKIASSCDPSGAASLKTYANSAFGNTIRDFLRQRRDIDLCNDWGLLLKLSQKRLTEVLTAEGLEADLIKRYVLAWQCFGMLYIPSKSPGLRRTAAPSSELWQAIANRFNQSSEATCTATTIERWLTYCAARVRANLYPSVASLNAPKAGYDSGEWQEDLEDSSRESLLSELIAQEDDRERQTQQQQMNGVLKEAIASLDQTMQELLQLYYQQNLTQQQIAKQLELQQYNVSRKLTKARETVLLKLTSWSREVLQTSIDSDTLKGLSSVLEDWLQNYYRSV